MKNSLLAILLATTTMTLSAQYTEEVVDDDDLFAPFRTVYKNVEDIDFSVPADRQVGSVLKHHVARKHDMMNGNYYGGQLVHAGKTYSETVTATQRSGGISLSTDNSTVRTGSGRRGSSVSERNMASRKAQVDRHVAFMQARAEARRQAAREAARREYERKLREQAIDNQRAVQVEAQTNARLQGTTNARIERDYHNATVGTSQARATSQSTANSMMRGPHTVVSQQPKRQTGAMSAQQLRDGIAARQRKPRVLYRAPQSQTPNSLTKPQPVIVRATPNKQGEYEFTGRMTKTTIHIKPDPRFGTPNPYSAPKTVAKNEGFRLSPHATVTTGQPIRIKDLEMREIPPRTPRIKNMTQEEREEMLRIMMYEEFFPEYNKKAKS